MPKPNEAEDIRTGYQAAVTLWVSESSLVWNRLNAMVVANTIILTFIGIAMTSERALPSAFLLTLCGAGVVLCILWLMMTARGYTYLTHFVDSARRLESLLSNKLVDTVSKGANARFSILGSVRGERLSYLIVSVFPIIYLVLIVLISLSNREIDTSLLPHTNDCCGTPDCRHVQIRPIVSIFGFNIVDDKVINAPTYPSSSPPLSAPPSVPKANEPTKQPTKPNPP